jgi:hypothetical protein
MNIFLKLLPYLIIVALGFGIYGGFKYMSNELAKAKEENICLTASNAELVSQIESLKETTNITVEQLEQIRKNEKSSLKYISEFSNRVNELSLTEDPEVILMKINNYEVCMAKNSMNPEVKCELELQ